MRSFISFVLMLFFLNSPQLVIASSEKNIILSSIHNQSSIKQNECPNSSGTYCQPPTAVCCGDETNGYFCATDTNCNKE